jgi:hypothetical protein
MKTVPPFSVMPFGFEWQQFRQKKMVKDNKFSTLRTYVPEEQYIRPTFDGQDSQTKTKDGQIIGTETKVYPNSVKKKRIKFSVKHLIDWGVGRCYLPNTGKDFVFPLDGRKLFPLVLKNINRRTIIGHDIYMETDLDIVRFVSIPTPRIKQLAYWKLLEKGNSEEEALAGVVQKTMIVIEKQDLIMVPKMIENTELENELTKYLLGL